MSELKNQRAGSVQFPMVRHAAGVGWIPITPETARQKRGGYDGMCSAMNSKLSSPSSIHG
jgi:type I restriction enzyme R subunit